MLFSIFSLGKGGIKNLLIKVLKSSHCLLFLGKLNSHASQCDPCEVLDKFLLLKIVAAFSLMCLLKKEKDMPTEEVSKEKCIVSHHYQSYLPYHRFRMPFHLKQMHGWWQKPVSIVFTKVVSSSRSGQASNTHEDTWGCFAILFGIENKWTVELYFDQSPGLLVSLNLHFGCIKRININPTLQKILTRWHIRTERRRKDEGYRGQS